MLTLDYFYLFIYVHGVCFCVCVSVPHAHSSSMEARRECRIIWNWRYKWLWAAMWIGNQTMSSGTAVNTLNPWASLWSPWIVSLKVSWALYFKIQQLVHFSFIFSKSFFYFYIFHEITRQSSWLRHKISVYRGEKKHKLSKSILKVLWHAHWLRAALGWLSPVKLVWLSLTRICTSPLVSVGTMVI